MKAFLEPLSEKEADSENKATRRRLKITTKKMVQNCLVSWQWRAGAN